MVKGEVLRSHNGCLWSEDELVSFLESTPLRFGKQDNWLPCLRRGAPIMTGQDKAASCRALAGWLRVGGVSCLQRCGVLSAHRMQQPPQPNHLAKLPGTGPGHFTIQLSSGGCFGSWATANGKHKTKQHTPEIRSLRYYLPEPLGPVSQLLHLYGFGESRLWVEWTSGQVSAAPWGTVNRAETHKQLTRGLAHHSRLTDSFSSRFWVPTTNQPCDRHCRHRRSRTRSCWPSWSGAGRYEPQGPGCQLNLRGIPPATDSSEGPPFGLCSSLIFLAGNQLRPDHTSKPPLREPEGGGRQLLGGVRERRKAADDTGSEASVAALLNLARDRLWGGGLAAYKERPAADQRVLAGNLGGLLHLLYYLGGNAVERNLGNRTRLLSTHPPLAWGWVTAKYPRRTTEGRRETANEISQVAKTQQLAGSANKLPGTFSRHSALSHY